MSTRAQFFHLFIKIRDPSDNDWLLYSNLTEKELLTKYVEPYNEGVDFHFIGRTINKKSIQLIFIFSSFISFDELVTTDLKKTLYFR